MEKNYEKRYMVNEHGSGKFIGAFLTKQKDSRNQEYYFYRWQLSYLAGKSSLNYYTNNSSMEKVISRLIADIKCLEKYTIKEFKDPKITENRLKHLENQLQEIQELILIIQQDSGQHPSESVQSGENKIEQLLLF